MNTVEKLKNIKGEIIEDLNVLIEIMLLHTI